MLPTRNLQQFELPGGLLASAYDMGNMLVISNIKNDPGNFLFGVAKGLLYLAHEEKKPVAIVYDGISITIDPSEKEAQLVQRWQEKKTSPTQVLIPDVLG